jgi:hypothetical protein
MSELTRSRVLARVCAGCLATALFAATMMPSRGADAARAPVLPDGTLGRAVGLGIQCVPYGSTVPSGPISYLARDAGKPGVPPLSSKERAVLQSIMRYVHSPLLRFTHVFAGGFIVYVTQVSAGICMDAGGGYMVLNQDCNTTYEPGENPDATSVVPTCPDYPRPWMHAAARPGS